MVVEMDLVLGEVLVQMSGVYEDPVQEFAAYAACPPLPSVFIRRPCGAVSITLMPSAVNTGRAVEREDGCAYPSTILHDPGIAGDLRSLLTTGI
jgi:hypothetical protein